MQEILLVGAGGHCKAVIDVIEQENKYKIAGIIDKKELLGTKVFGYEVIGSDDDLPHLYDKYKNAVVTVGHIKSNEIRKKLFALLKKCQYTLPIIISPLAYVSKHASIEEGTIIMHQALINADAKVGKNCIINTKALIEHDATINNHCHISTGAIINGGVVVNENSFVGSNATSKEYIQCNGFNKAGSVIK